MTFGSGAYGTLTFGGSGSSGSSSVGVTGWGGSVTVFVEVDLSQAVDGVDAGAASYVALWDSAVWDSDEWADGIAWTDVTSDVQSVQISSRFSRLNESYNAGTCTVVLNNRSGDYSPGNTASPYRLGDSTTIGIWRPLRVRARYATGSQTIDWPLFTGYIRAWDESFPLTARDAKVTVVAADTFSKLAAFENYAQSSAGGGELSGARITRILDAAGYAGDRNIDAGGNTLVATTLEGNTISLLKATAEAEGGAVWCGPDGAIYFDGKNALIEKNRSNTVQATFSDDGASTTISYSDIDASYDGDLVTNMAAFTASGGTVQTAASTPSRVLYGDRQVTKTGLLVDSDAQALALASREVAVYQTPERRVESLVFNPIRNGSVAWTALATRRIQLRALCRVQLTPPAGDVLDRYVFVQGITHRIDRSAAGWTVDLEFSSASVWYAQVASLWDTGVWDSEGWTF